MLQVSVALIAHIAVAWHNTGLRRQSLTRHTCTNCGTVFADEQFCPNCGQWVDPLADEGFEEFTLAGGPSDEEGEYAPITSVTRATTACPSCGAVNPAQNRHCEECGARLAQGPLPVAPQPIVQMSAGARALMVIASVLVAVVLVAIIFNLFRGPEENGGGATPQTTTTVASAPPGDVQRIDPISVECSSQLRQFPCGNLIDGDVAAAWNDAGLRGVDAEINFTFVTPVAFEEVLFKNLVDEEKHSRNFRVQEIQVDFDDMDVPVLHTLADDTEPQVIRVVSFRTTTVTLRVLSTYAGQDWNGEPAFDELAIAEIEFYGRPTPEG